MATNYIIDFSDPSKPTVTVGPGSKRTDIAPITVLGQGASTYGEVFNENFLHLVENFASPEDPGNPGNPTALAVTQAVEGMLWFDTTTSVNILKVYHSGGWHAANNIIVDPTSPASASTGQLWFNSATDQLMVFDGTQWESVATHYLPLVGGAMSGDIDMQGNRITNLPTPVAVNEAATMGYVDGLIASSNELAEISDVVISTPVANNELLAFNSTTSEWINQTADEADIYDKTAADSRFMNVTGDTATGTINFEGSSGSGSGPGALITDPTNNVGSSKKVAFFNSSADANGGGIIIHAGDNSGDATGIELYNSFGSGGSLQRVFGITATHGHGYIKGNLTIGGDLTVDGNITMGGEDVASESYVNAAVAAGSGALAGSVPAINPGTPKDGDIQVSAGPTISVYAAAAWRQIYPAIYS